MNAPRRRTGFEVSGWDGTRWIMEGIFETAVEAASEAKLLLGRRLGVKVTEEVFSDSAGTYKSRVVYTEYREGAVRPQKRSNEPAAGAPPAKQGNTRGATRALSGDVALLASVTALAISVAALLLSLMR